MKEWSGAEVAGSSDGRREGLGSSAPSARASVVIIVVQRVDNATMAGRRAERKSCGCEQHPQGERPGSNIWSVITHGSTRETNIRECIYLGCQRQTQEHNTPDTVHTADAVGLTHIPPRGL